MNVFKRLLMLSGGGTSVPYDYPDKFAFFADQAVVQPSILEVLRPSDRLGDFTVVRGSSATYVDSDGIIKEALDNVARIDHTNGVAELLTEPQSTNLIDYSEDFSQWQAVRTSALPNQILSPDGTINAYKLNDSVDNNTHILQKIAITVVNTSHTYSIFAKKGGYNFIQVRNNTATQSWCYFDIENGSELGSSNIESSNIESYGNGWFKCSVTFTPTGTSIQPQIRLSDNGVRDIFAGTGNDGIYIFGAQLEALPYSTSYIPTNGSSVTRLQDQITSGGNSSVINSEEGTMFFEGSALTTLPSENYNISISDGSSSNRVYLKVRSSGAVDAKVDIGGVSVASAILSNDITINFKLAIKWKLNDFSMWVNGVEIHNVDLGNTFISNTLNTISFDNGIDGIEPFFGRTRELRIADRALTDEELENLTTL